MMLETIVAADVLQIIGWTVVHFIWQGAAIGVLAAIAMAICRREKPEVRYLIGITALALMALAPVITTPFVVAVVLQDGVSMPSLLVLADLPPESFWTRLESLLPSVAWAWLIGTLLLQLRLCLHWCRAQRYRQAHVAPVGTGWQLLADELATSMGIRRAVAVMESAVASTPMLVGWARPVILVPAAALTGLSSVQLRAILAHELAHVRRHDYLINLVQSFVESMLFFHPIVWWLSGRIRTEREYCCDDAAVRVCGDALVYAQALANLESLRCTPGSVEPAMASTGGSLMNRICRIVGVRNPMPRRLGGWIAPAAVTLATTAVVSAVGMSPLPAETVAPCPPTDEVVDLTIDTLLPPAAVVDDLLAPAAIDGLLAPPAITDLRTDPALLPLLSDTLPLLHTEGLALDSLATPDGALLALVPEVLAVEDGRLLTMAPEIVAPYPMLDPALAPCPPDEEADAATALEHLYRFRAAEAADADVQRVDRSVIQWMRDRAVDDEDVRQQLHEHLLQLDRKHADHRVAATDYTQRLHDHLKTLLHQHQDELHGQAEDHVRRLHDRMLHLLHQHQDEIGESSDHLKKLHDHLSHAMQQHAAVDMSQHKTEIQALVEAMQLQGMDPKGAQLPKVVQEYRQRYADRLDASLMDTEMTRADLEQRLAVAEQRLADTQAMIERLTAGQAAQNADNSDRLRLYERQLADLMTELSDVTAVREQQRGLLADVARDMSERKRLMLERFAMDRAIQNEEIQLNKDMMAERIAAAQAAAQEAARVGDHARARQLMQRVAEFADAANVEAARVAEQAKKATDIARLAIDRSRPGFQGIRERLNALTEELSADEIQMILEHLEPLLHEIKTRRQQPGR